jgi:hypothetical protein
MCSLIKALDLTGGQTAFQYRIDSFGANLHRPPQNNNIEDPEFIAPGLYY